MKKLIFVGMLAFSIMYANESSMELEHAIKTSNGVDSPKMDMSKMKASGKCGADQKTSHSKYTSSKKSKSDLELEHAIKTSNGVDSPKMDMSKMKASGKCGNN